ncbi:Putative uncharacterized protein pSV2.03 [Propionibacterium freudenreichii]|nr:Putative uncharacterized protein pSV2.03 [Propionibacterium freudenreichii]CEI28643.1 Putative uncharacterized protein pSV2.03 [Propionibacterium freudenreichii]
MGSLVRSVGCLVHHVLVQWRSRRSNPAKLDVLHGGVPPWLKRPLVMWVESVMVLQRDRYGGIEFQRWPDVNLLQEYETATRRPESWLPKLNEYGVDGLCDAMGPEDFLDFVDFLVFHTQRLGSHADVCRTELEALLENAGSAWKVGERDGHAALEKRVPEGVADAVDDTVSSAGEAGSLLAEAWRSLYGRSPDTEDAYEKAIKAVEEAGASIVSPDNKRASLGTMVRDMKAQKDWALDLPTGDADVPVKMAAALWVGQEGRHGGNGYRKPTQAEAEAAVMLAVPLVQWFTSGAIQRRSQSIPSV